MDNKKTDLKESVNNLLNTRDMSMYLDILAALREQYLIILSVKDTPKNIPEGVVGKIHSLGLSKLTREHWRAYIGIIDKGNVLFDSSSEKADASIEYSLEVSDFKMFVSSNPRKNGSANIQINDEEYSLNCRGLNIVVYDYSSDKVIDSVTYDSYLTKPTFFHKNLHFSEQYFDSHFFVPERYKEVWREPFRKKCYSNRKPGVTEVEEGVILPIKSIKGRRYGGACDSDFNFISGHANYVADAFKNERCVLESYRPEEDELEYVDEEVIYCGIVYSHPGHLIIESAAEFLWYVAENCDMKTKIVLETAMWDKSYFLEYADLLNIPEDRFMFITRPTKFKKVIIPDASEMLYWYCNAYEVTDKYSSFFEIVKKDVVPAEYKKIYLTKTKTAHGNIVGEDIFIEFYKKRGFEIINPEDYTLREKIALMLGADEVATGSGTNHVFTIFCRPSTKVTVLSRVNNSCYNTGSMEMISEVTGMKDIYIVDISNNFFDKKYTFSLHLLTMTEDFKKYAKAYFNENIEDDFSESNKNYAYEYLKRMPKYYSEDRIKFDCIKNLKMINVLQNLSQFFYGEDFKTEGLDLTTDEDKLRKQVEKLTTELSNAKKRIAELESGHNCYGEDFNIDGPELKIDENKIRKQMGQLTTGQNNVKKRIDELENGHTNKVSNCKMLTGNLSIISDSPHVSKKEHVDFPKEFFTKPPCVFANPKTAVPGTKVLGIGVTNITKTGCDIYITRSDASGTGICWFAIET